MKRIFVLFSFLVFFACKNNEEKNESSAGEQQTAGTRKYSDVFNSSVTGALNAYYQLKDAFVASDVTKADSTGTVLKQLVDSLNLDELKQKDSAAYQSISGRLGDVTAEITGMLGEKDLEKKRESFEMISNAFYDIIRTIRPDGVTAYYQYCSMAFNDKGAYWLSNSDSIRNPYFGKKMLICGEVKEEMKY